MKLEPTLVKVVFSELPIARAPRTMETEIIDAMSTYSIEVAPALSRANRRAVLKTGQTITDGSR